MQVADNQSETKFSTRMSISKSAYEQRKSAYVRCVLISPGDEGDACYRRDARITRIINLTQISQITL